jgi:putative peptidoglycan lipid II flippase
VKQQKFDEIKRRLLKLNFNLVLVCIPAVVIGCIWHEEIIRIIFERGAFNARSTEMVSSLFYYFSLGDIPYVLKEFLVRTFYSFGDSRTPLYVMVVTILLKAGLNYTLIPVMGLKALAFSMMVLNIISFLALLVFFIIRFRKVRGAVKSLNQNPEPL